METETICIHDALKLLEDLGAKQRENCLEAILASLSATFDQKPLYPTAANRAANLFYFMIKGHALLDGTTRGAALLLDEYLKRSGLRPVPVQIVGVLANLVEPSVVGETSSQHKDRVISEIEKEIVSAQRN